MKYSVHRALAMLKTTKARIERELSNQEVLWVRVARGQEDVVSGVTVKDIQRSIQAHYDRITALISNYTKIKAAVIQSNAGVIPGTDLRKVDIAGQALTVAEIIELVDTVYGRAGKPGCPGDPDRPELAGGAAGGDQPGGVQGPALLLERSRPGGGTQPGETAGKGL